MVTRFMYSVLRQRLSPEDLICENLDTIDSYEPLVEVVLTLIASLVILKKTQLVRV